MLPRESGRDSGARRYGNATGTLFMLALLAALTLCGVEATARVCIHSQIVAEQLKSAGSYAARSNVTLSRSRATREPIRIFVLTFNLDDQNKRCTAAGQKRPNFRGATITCTADDVVTQYMHQRLRNLVMPFAMSLHSARLKVNRLTSPLVVPPMKGSICGSFGVPSEDQTHGLDGADYALYISAAPNAAADVIAWSAICHTEATGQPYVGVMNVAPRYINPLRPTVRTIAHEVLHNLGFDSAVFASKGGMLSSRSIRGKPASQVMTSSRVVNRTKGQYNCPTVNHMEMEDEGDELQKSNHWKGRNARDELMSPVYFAGYYTAITIAAMEDLGFYEGNYENAEVMRWGHQAGCGLLTDKCVANGLTSFPDMFCTKQDAVACTADRRAIGRCSLASSTAVQPAPFLYFSNNKLTGNTPFMDRCPTYDNKGIFHCDNEAAAPLGSVTGLSARCFTAMQLELANGAFVDPAICVDVQCQFGGYFVKIYGAKNFQRCTPGSYIPLMYPSTGFRDGYIQCPPYDEVCNSN